MDFAEVESNDYCRKVLKMRMDEKLLPEGTIECDVVTVKPPRKTRGAGGGFPCQAGQVISNLYVFVFQPFFNVPRHHAVLTRWVHSDLRVLLRQGCKWG